MMLAAQLQLIGHFKFQMGGGGSVKFQQMALIFPPTT